MGTYTSAILAVAAGFVATSPSGAAGSAEQVEFFEKRIRPVLAQECYECHSERTKRRGGLLLDSRPGWQQGGDSGDAIVPGSPGTSLLLQSMKHTHPELKMPKNGARLDDNVLRDFEKWISEGAVDPRDVPPSPEQLKGDTDWQAVMNRRKEWWAFQPVRPPPLTREAEQRPVDHLLEAKLSEAGLSPAPRADDETLLRRLHYVLTGLPPTPAEMDSFLAACAEDRMSATEKAVDSLLTSPHFGEKWARHWMDWVRYAESYGSEGDPPIPYAWRYRDYLIRAFNDDVPYYQMLKEAVAGDLLSQPRVNHELGINESAIGVAQLRMVMHGFSPTDSLDELVTFTDNQIDVVSKAFQALTVSCARCHDHKFDAISQADFYSWYGIFTSTRPAVIDVCLDERGERSRAEMAALREQIRQVVGRIWLDAALRLPAVDRRGVETVKPAAGDTYWDLRKERWTGDGPSVKRGAQPAGTFTIAHEGDQIISHILPSGIYSHLDSTKDRGVLMSPQFKCQGGTLWIRSAGEGTARVRYIVQNYPRTGTIHKAVDLETKSSLLLGWRKLDLSYWKGDDIYIEASTAADRPVETKLDERSWFGITDVLITHSDLPPPELAEGGVPADAVRAWMNGSITDAQALLLNRLLQDGKLPNDRRSFGGELVQRYRQLEASLPPSVRVPGVMEQRGQDAPLFVQGDHKRPGELVKRRFLDAVDAKPFETSLSGRLELAEHLASPSNPLTDRVIVNRLWHHLFGNGISGTLDNFGRLGEKPSHPELLDWLAATFRQENGSLKQMIRRLVLTDAFARASTAPPEAAVKDPQNRLLSHWTVRRLEAEAVRDSMLALSGELDRTLIGESVPGSSARRSIYVQVIRNRLDPLLTTFDAPVPAATRGKRDSTNVPAQSLALMNDPGIHGWAKAWASHKSGSPEQKAAAMLREATGRRPTPEAIRATLDYLQSFQSEVIQWKNQRQQTRNAHATAQAELEALLATAKRKVEAPQEIGAEPVANLPHPMAEWDFENSAQDLLGALHLQLEGGATIQDGALVLDGAQSLARSAPLSKPLHAKTLEAWVQLADLKQSGGGVITVQDLRGNVFDSIVYGEKSPGQWLAGSDHHRRTQSLQGTEEKEAQARPIHLAIAWAKDGTITAFRDGVRYGTSYKAPDIVQFAKGEAEVLLGCRHGAPVGNRLLRGRILRARLYDRALSADELARTMKLEPSTPSTEELIQSLPEADQKQAKELTVRLALMRDELHRQETRLNPLLEEHSEWASLALALFNTKEFVYLK